MALNPDDPYGGRVKFFTTEACQNCLRKIDPPGPIESSAGATLRRRKAVKPREDEEAYPLLSTEKYDDQVL